ncbi:MAG: hypothetical protein H0U10_12655, partial [Chloroflexia bacterium]|nr:hypothetical protein [Chloroflexia bacterium]
AAARAVRLLPAGAPVGEVVGRLGDLWAGIQAEGLDRPLVRPASREPSIRDLELVCWELVVTPEMARTGAIPDAAAWGNGPPPAEQLPLGQLRAG